MATSLFLLNIGFSFIVSSQGYDYGQVLGDSLLFYEAQRSGHLPSTNRIPWRGDSMLNDKGENGLDLTGGYFDAGDHVKFGLPMASTATVLGWGLLGYTQGYKNAGEYENGLAALRWATDYFIKAHPSANELYSQVGDGNIDHAYWGRPEDYTGPRPAFKLKESSPGSDLAGETSAALAVASMVFRNSGDTTYANLCLRHAKELYSFANNFRGKYSDTIQNSTFYTSSGYGDELAWAATWLFKASGEQNYLTEAKEHYDYFGIDNHGNFGWDGKSAGVQVLLAQTTNETLYRNAALRYCEYMINDAPRTPKKLVFLGDWGSLRSSANMVFICMKAADMGLNSQKYYDLARQQIGYMLGDTGRSFVVGYGVNPPTKPHHRASSCPSPPAKCDFSTPGPNPHTLTGALVGGPDKDDNYVDSRGDYVHNEVATDYNAGFTSALAGLVQLSI